VSILELTPEELEAALSEIAILRQLRHPNIVRYEDSYRDVDAGVLNIVMEFASEGDLGNKIKAREGVAFPEEIICMWLLEISMAMDYLHMQRYITLTDLILQS